MKMLKVDSQDQLLQARKQGLEHAERMSLRPLGKLWGMDVFTWMDPLVDELVSTLPTFPFPVSFFAPSELIKDLVHHDESVLASINWIAQYDNAQMLIPSTIAKQIPLISATQSIEDAFMLLSKNVAERRIVLFTVQGQSKLEHLSKIEHFVKSNQ